MPEAESVPASARVLIDAGMFIAALLKGDPRHAEARPLVEQARQGGLPACTTAGILSEVYGALTWEKAERRHSPTDAAASSSGRSWPATSKTGRKLDAGPDALYLYLVIHS